MSHGGNQFSTKVRGPLMYMEPHIPPAAVGYLGRPMLLPDTVRKQLGEYMKMRMDERGHTASPSAMHRAKMWHNDRQKLGGASSETITNQPYRR